MRTLDTGKRGEYLVLVELLKRGASVYVPVVDAEGIDAIIRRADEHFVEIQVKTIGTVKTPRWFQITGLEPRPSLFIVGVTLALHEPETWIIPSEVFEHYANISKGKSGRKIYDLDLNGGIKKYGEPLKDKLSQYRDAWHLLTGDRERLETEALARASEPSFAEDWLSGEDSVYDTL